MSSVAAPPQHPAPFISNTSVMYCMYRVVRESVVLRTSRTRALALVRESEV